MHAHRPLRRDTTNLDPTGVGTDDAVPDLRSRLIAAIAGSALRGDDDAPTTIVSGGTTDRSGGRARDAGQCQNADAYKIVGHKCLAFDARQKSAGRRCGYATTTNITDATLAKLKRPHDLDSRRTAI